jgi:hypothetical protein
VSTETEASHTRVPLTAVSRSVVVQAPIEVAFKVFTEQFDRIKPREHNLLSVEIAETVFERGVGGYLFEADLERTSEVEVRFIAEGEDRTRVQLEHRNLDRHGDDWPMLRDGIGGEGGWPLYLQRFADLVAQAVPTPAPGPCPARSDG